MRLIAGNVLFQIHFSVWRDSPFSSDRAENQESRFPADPHVVAPTETSGAAGAVGAVSQGDRPSESGRTCPGLPNCSRRLAISSAAENPAIHNHLLLSLSNIIACIQIANTYLLLHDMLKTYIIDNYIFSATQGECHGT